MNGMISQKDNTAGVYWGLAIWVFFSVVAYAAFYYHAAPSEILPEDGSPLEFSAARAMRHIQAIASKPHVAGTAENAAVRDYISQQLKTMGVDAEIQETVIHWRPGCIATVQNVLGRIPGQNNTKAVALAAHYDSVPFGPGAADDGAGVAVLLETARALKAGPPLKNDVIFVFTDGEESSSKGSGLRGARAFAGQHPWAKNVGVMLNFDCRGNSGPAYMYETSGNNGWLLDQFSKADCHPVASSFMSAIYEHVPGASDFTIFKRSGLQGMNFAFIYGQEYYHTALDSPANVSSRSVQHHGLYALRLARRLGNQSLADITGTDAVYFNPIGDILVRYRAFWIWPITLAALALLAVLFAVAARQNLITRASLAASMSRCVLGYGLVVIFAGLAVATGLRLRGPYLLYTGRSVTIALFAFSAVLHLLFIRRRIQADGYWNVTLGALLWWGLFLLIAVFFIPGGSYLLAWPLFFAAAGLLSLVLWQDSKLGGMLRLCIWAAYPVPAILLFVPLFKGVHGTLAPSLYPAQIVFLLLLLGLLTPHIHGLGQRLERISIAVLILLGLGEMVEIIWWHGFSPEQPKMSALSYAMDADSGKACWMSSGDQLDAWNVQFIPAHSPKMPAGEFFPGNREEFWRAPAPLASLEPPRVEMLSDRYEQEKHELRFHVSSPRGACRLVLYAGEQSNILRASVNDILLKPVEGRWFLDYSILPRKGFDLTIETPPGTGLTFTAIDESPALPALPGLAISPRPPNMMPRSNTFDVDKSLLKSDATITVKTYQF